MSASGPGWDPLWPLLCRTVINSHPSNPLSGFQPDRIAPICRSLTSSKTLGSNPLPHSRGKALCLVDMFDCPLRRVRGLGLLTIESAWVVDLMDGQILWRLSLGNWCLGPNHISQRPPISRQFAEQLEMFLSIPIIEIPLVLLGWFHFHGKQERRSGITSLVRVILLNEFIVSSVKVTNLGRLLALRPHPTRVSHAIEVVLGFERFLEVRLIQCQELARMWYFRCEREVVGFAIEGRACRCLAVHQVGQMFVYVPFGPEIIVDPRTRFRSGVDVRGNIVMAC